MLGCIHDTLYMIHCTHIVIIAHILVINEEHGSLTDPRFLKYPVSLVPVHTNVNRDPRLEILS